MFAVGVIALIAVAFGPAAAAAEKEAVVGLSAAACPAHDTPQSVIECATSSAADNAAFQAICAGTAEVIADGQRRCLAAAIGAGFATFPDGRRFVGVAGRFTYDNGSASVTAESRFDMASCSKVLGGTTAAAQLYQAGLLDLDAPVTRYLGSGFAVAGKGAITIRNLLLHNAGFPPDPTPYWYNDPSFGCPETAQYFPAQSFSCESKILAAVLNQTLANPVGATYVYSDLSLITLMYVIGTIVRQAGLVGAAHFPAPCAATAQTRETLVCHYYAYVKRHVFDRLGLTSTDFIPTNTILTPPQWQDNMYHHRMIMGFVSDGNAFAMGGVSGHAGVFSTAGDALTFISSWLTASESDPVLNATTVRTFTTVANISQSSRALGWDTNAQRNPPCGTLSNLTFFHVGYTGTQVCADPVARVATVLLTNGRYPDPGRDGAVTLRPEYNSAVDAFLKNPPSASRSGPAASPPCDGGLGTSAYGAGIVAGLGAAVALLAALLAGTVMVMVTQRRRLARRTVPAADDVADVEATLYNDAGRTRI